MTLRELQSPVSERKKFEIFKGDASANFNRYILDNPETIVSLAYFSMGVYEPTYQCLMLLKECMPKGSIIAFSTIGLKEFVGDTKALQKAFGLKNIRLQRSPYSHYESFFVVE
jgi:hypothetical protein